MKLLRRLAGLVTGVAALTTAAVAQITVTVPNGTQSWDLQGDPQNQAIQVTYSGPRMILDQIVTLSSGTLTTFAASQAPADSKIRMTSSRYPGIDNDIIPIPTYQSFSGSTSVNTNIQLGLAGGLEYKEILPGDVLTFEFYQSPDRRVNLADAVWDNLVFNLQANNPPEPTAEDLGVLPNGLTLRSTSLAVGQVKWYKFTVLAAVDGNRFLDFDTSGSTGIPNFDTSLGLYNSDGFLLQSDEGSGAVSAGALGFGEPRTWGGRSAVIPYGFMGNGQDGILQPGVYYLAVGLGGTTFRPYNYGVLASNSLSGTVNLLINKNVDQAPAWPPVGFTDLGTLSQSGSLTLSLPVLGGKWYRLVLPQIASPGWLDIDTEGTLDFLSISSNINIPDNNTYLALFDATGTPVASDAHRGSGFRAMMSFGDTTSRGYLQTGSDPGSDVRMGYNGSLAAGTYYLYVGGDIAGAYQGSVVTSNACAGDIVLNARYGPMNKRTITVFSNLMDWTGDPDRIVHWELLDGPNGNVLESGFSLSNQGYHVIQLDTMSGTGYTLTMKASHWLRGATQSLNLNSNVSNRVINLVNGDVDGDNEVGPGDFGELAQAFLSVEGDPNWNIQADLDGDGEVGPGDFSILANNFLMAGYGA